MDGIPAASFPAPPTAPPGVPPPPGQYPSQAPPAPKTAAVGRPSADPEQQVAREERSVIKRRMASVMPKEMSEPRIAIYRLAGRKGTTKMTSRPIMTVLLTELERAGTEGTEGSEFIRAKIEEKFPDTHHRYLWEAQDHKGVAIPDFGKHEVDMSNEHDDEIEDENEEEYDDGSEIHIMRHDAEGSDGRPKPPLTGSPLPPQQFIKEIRRVATDQHKRDDSSSSMMMQLMMQQQETRRLEEAARLEREERRRDDERKEKERREERDEQRRKDEQRERERDQERKEAREREDRANEQQRQMQFMKMIMDSTNRPPPEDKMTPILLKMFDSKSDRDGTKELFGMFNEASKQSMLMQGEASKHMMGAQAEASKMLISNILGISKQMVEAQLEANAPENEGDDPMDKIGRMFKMFAPAISALGGGAAVQQQITTASQQQPQIAQQPQQAPVQQPKQNAPVTRKTHAQIPDAEWIKGGLDTIMNMEMGRIPIDQRFHALKWCAENMPDRMLTAIRSGDENNVFAVGQEGASGEFTAWLMGDETHVEFLRGCVGDIRHLLLNTMTQEVAQASVKKHQLHMQMKNGQPFPTQETTAEVVEEKRTGGKRSAPPPKEEPVAVDTPTQAPTKDETTKELITPGNI